MDIDSIKVAVSNGSYRYSKHADQERQNDDLSLIDVHQAILNGRIIENYSNTGRGESCLIAGFSDAGVPVHIVCGGTELLPVIITVYIPTPPKFKNPFERVH